MLCAYLLSAGFWMASALWHYLLGEEWRVSGAALNAIAALLAAVGSVASVDHAWQIIGFA